MLWNLTGPCKNKPCSDHPWISSIVIHGPLPVATLCNPSSHWHLFAVESQRNAKVLAMICFMSRNVIWNLLSNPFPQRWKKKEGEKRKRKIADQVQTHACWLFGTHGDEVKPASCSKLGGLSFWHQPKLRIIPTNYNCTPSFLGHAKTHTHNTGLWYCLGHKSCIHGNKFKISESDLPSQSLPLAIRAALEIFETTSLMAQTQAKRIMQDPAIQTQ